MAAMDLAVGMIFVSQTVLGIWGNVSLLYHYISLHFTGCRLRSTDMILRNIVVSNSLVILTKGIPYSVAALGWQYVPNDFGCKFVFYLHKVGRDVSIFSTCLLSVFQALTISPRCSRWAELKRKAPKSIKFTIILGWIFYLLLNVMTPVNMIGKWSYRNITKRRDFVYCSSTSLDKTMQSVYTALVIFPDVLCLVLMLWASTSMVYVLYRHQQQVRHIQRNTASPSSSPETRVTQSILVLVSTFVFFYTSSSILHICIFHLNIFGSLLVNISALIAACFPTISPFLLRKQGSSVSVLRFSRARKENPLRL
ncbi:vomeronasal type-1 receptor 4 [Echinops telfairi]|uniref:Vomeronasal type-1 receptor n=1 Tax=Echinops telfairi TaxID=9371 RepID=A0ABM0ZTI0_ECHTE|nr:vomeronasal type-1 receptor 4 [Echinops telfairi]